MAIDDHIEFSWHRACVLLKRPLDRRGGGWPDRLNIEEIAKLHFPTDEPPRRALLSLLEAAIAKGDLVPAGTERVPEKYLVGILGPPGQSQIFFSRYPAALPQELPHLARTSGAGR